MGDIHCVLLCNGADKERNSALRFDTERSFAPSMGKHALSALLAALIALPMYYMFYSMFSKGFETGPFIVALVIGVGTFVITLVIATVIGRQKQKVA